MANKDAAFGLKPIGKIGQNADNNGLSEYDIAASATAIYFQDPVEILATGTILQLGNLLFSGFLFIFHYLVEFFRFF